MKGDNHRSGLSPKTFLKLTHPVSLLRFSFLRFSILVESHHIDLICIMNIISVNSENKSVSNTRKTSIIRFSGAGLPFLDISGHEDSAPGQLDIMTVRRIRIALASG